jgi:hypothetical protein
MRLAVVRGVPLGCACVINGTHGCGGSTILPRLADHAHGPPKAGAKQRLPSIGTLTAEERSERATSEPKLVAH